MNNIKLLNYENHNKAAQCFNFLEEYITTLENENEELHSVLTNSKIENNILQIIQWIGSIKEKFCVVKVIQSRFSITGSAPAYPAIEVQRGDLDDAIEWCVPDPPMSARLLKEGEYGIVKLTKEELMNAQDFIQIEFLDNRDYINTADNFWEYYEFIQEI